MVMNKFSASRILALAAASFISIACGKKDEPVRTRDDIAADSALAADLALANRDTLLIDSIGQYSPPGAGADTSLSEVDPVSPPGALPPDVAERSATVHRQPRPVNPPVAARPAPPPTPPPSAPAARPSPPRAVAKSSPARRTSGTPRHSGAGSTQQCVIRDLPKQTDDSTVFTARSSRGCGGRRG